MICSDPYTIQGVAFGCGRCDPCRMFKRREWSTRLQLESYCHKDSAFITLMYNDKHLPEDGSVDPRELQLFMKKLRKKLETPVRFYGVGEYGRRTGRAHYHVIVFGMLPCDNIVTKLGSYKEQGYFCCEVCTSLRDLWGKGSIHCGRVEPASCAYVAGYVTKKLQANLLKGRRPEFARMSNRPGIGLNFMDEIASDMMTHKLDEYMEDVPTVIRTNGRIMPLGRYLRRGLRARIGRDVKTPESVLRAWQEKMSPVYEAAKAAAPKGQLSYTFRGLVMDLFEGKRLQVKRRAANVRKGDQT